MQEYAAADEIKRNPVMGPLFDFRFQVNVFLICDRRNGCCGRNTWRLLS